MLEAESTHAPSTFWTPARKGWLVILLGFLIFCGLGVSGAYAGMQLLRAREQSPFQVKVEQPEAVLVRPLGAIQASQVADSEDLDVGTTLIIAEKAAPGVAGIVHLFPGDVSAWANTQLQVEQRGGVGQANRLRLLQGQIIVDLPSTAAALEISTITRTVELTAPGYYRVRQLAKDSLTTGVAERDSAPDTEVAVASGEAIVNATRVLPGGRQVSDPIRIPPGGRQLLAKGNRGYFQNAWPLLRDGKFTDFSVDEYNLTQVQDSSVKKSDTWQVRVQNPVVQSQNSVPGYFDLDHDCPKGSSQPQECRIAANFVRTGFNDLPSIIAITQDIRADVVSYDKLQLTASIRIRKQSLSKTGVAGTECPVLIRVFYTNSQSSDAKAEYCFWAYEYANQKSTKSNYPWIKTIHIYPNEWSGFSIDLKHEIPDLLTIQQIEVHANGHDYDTNVADISLDGIDLTQQPLLPASAPHGATQRTPEQY